MSVLPVNKFQALPPSFNNQNMRLAKVGDFWTASFPTHAGRVRVPLATTERQAQWLAQTGSAVKQGAAKLYEKRGRWYLALSITVEPAPCAGDKMAGVDLGLRNLAVVSCEGQRNDMRSGRRCFSTAIMPAMSAAVCRSCVWGKPRP